MREAAPSPIDIPRPAVLHQQLIVSLFGLYSRAPGTAMPVAALVSLLGDLGYDEQGVRSAVSRLKAKGILHPSRLGRVAAYDLTGSLRSTFNEGDERIFAESLPDHPHDWVLALFSVPETQRNLRHKLRKILTGLGYGTVSSGMWIANGRFMTQTQERLAHHGLSEYVEFFRGDYLFDGDMKAQVARWWDLDQVDGLLADFLELYGDAEEIWTQAVGEDPVAAFRQATPEQCRDAFRYYVPMLTMWRHLPYEDPNLPADYMPEGWKEPDARKAFVHTHRLISPLAERHARRVIQEHLPLTEN
jgi:phenylacetic acid degradation operon negative regulatory protein